MDLIGWIEINGPQKVSDTLGVEISTVYKWKNLKGCPQFENAAKIKKLTKGRLGFNEIYAPYFKEIVEKSRITKD